MFRVASLSGCSRNNDARVPLRIGRWSHFARVVSVSPTSSLLYPSPLFPNLRSLSRPLPSFSFFFVGDHTSACHLFRCVLRLRTPREIEFIPPDLVIRRLLNLGIEFYLSQKIYPPGFLSLLRFPGYKSARNETHFSRNGIETPSFPNLRIFHFGNIRPESILASFILLKDYQVLVNTRVFRNPMNRHEKCALG